METNLEDPVPAQLHCGALQRAEWMLDVEGEADALAEQELAGQNIVSFCIWELLSEPARPSALGYPMLHALACKKGGYQSRPA